MGKEPTFVEWLGRGMVVILNPSGIPTEIRRVTVGIIFAFAGIMSACLAGGTENHGTLIPLWSLLLSIPTGILGFLYFIYAMVMADADKERKKEAGRANVQEEKELV